MRGSSHPGIVDESGVAAPGMVSELLKQFETDGGEQVRLTKPAVMRGWLESFLETLGIDKLEDTGKTTYKGWEMPSTRITLIRIANFLADEDVDRTENWHAKIGEITEYLAFLAVRYVEKGGSWGYELNDAIHMMKVHDIYERYHYSLDTPNLSGNTVSLARKSILNTPRPRFALLEGTDRQTHEPDSPRNLLHRLPQGVVDGMYVMSREALKSCMARYFKDEKFLWSNEIPTLEWNRKISYRNNMDKAKFLPGGFNMVETEDETFMACMRLGPLRALKSLKTACSLNWNPRATEGEEMERLRWDWCRFRGANRAGLTMVLRAFGSQTKEIRALESPYRKLILETARERRERRRRKARGPEPGIIWDPITYQNPKPEVDSMTGYIFWHKRFVEENEKWLPNILGELRQYWENKFGKDPSQRPPLPDNGLWAPLIAVGMYEEQYANFKLLGKLNTIKRNLLTAQRLYPRRFLDEVLDYLENGQRNALPPARQCRVGSAGQPEHEALRTALSEGDEWELCVLSMYSHRPTSHKLLEPLPTQWPMRKRIFADRLNALVHDLSEKSCFEKDSLEFDALLKSINRCNSGNSFRRIKFKAAEARDFLEELWKMGRVG